MYTYVQADDAIKFGASMLNSGNVEGGIFEIDDVCHRDRAFHYDKPSIKASCSFDSDGGWLVILKRDAAVSEHVKFNRSWTDYKQGFGDLGTEFWYGLDNIHCLTTQEPVDLTIELKRNNGTEIVWTYGHFVVDGAYNKYTLHIGEAKGPTGLHDAMARHNGKPFTTYDSDNDERGTSNCATTFGGGWWHTSCFDSQLTGPHERGGGQVQLQWRETTTGGLDSFKYFPTVTMKIRPKRCKLSAKSCTD